MLTKLLNLSGEIKSGIKVLFRAVMKNHFGDEKDLFRGKKSFRGMKESFEGMNKYRSI